MSETLKSILNHWIGDAPSKNGFIDLPFNIEEFCRENDAKLTDKNQIIEEMNQNCISRSLHESKMSVVEKERDMMVKALEFYGDKFNWYPNESFKTSGRINDSDLGYFSGNQTSDLIGGKLARETLQKLGK